MTTDVYLSAMKLKETGGDRILGYYKKNKEWDKLQGDSPEEFIAKIRAKIGNDTVFHNKEIPYFNKLIPIPKPVDEDTYDKIKKLDKIIKA